MSQPSATSPFMVRLSVEVKALITVRSKLTGRSLAGELKSMLQVLMSNDPCSEVEIAKDRGRYVIRSHHSSEVFRSFVSKDLAFAAAQAAFSDAGLDPANVIDMTGEESIHAG